MTLGTICSGIGAPEVALHGIGYSSIWCSQFDPEHNYKRGPDFPSAVIAHRFPEVPNYGDFTTLLREPPATPDVLIGGTPCQSFSVAGLRGGLSDPRGGLTLAFVALVGLLRPRWIVWENVPGVFSADDGRAFGSLLSGLGNVGYGWAYRVLDAQYFGVAQRRERVFVVGHFGGDWRRAGAVLFEPEGVRWDSPPSREAGKSVAGALGASASGRGWRCGADEVAAGQAVAFGIGDEVGRSLNAHPSRYDSETETLVSFVQDVADPITASTYKHGGASGGKDSQPRNHIATSGPVGLGVRRTTPREQERLQGFPDDWTLIPWKGKPAVMCPDGPRSKALGNSMAVPVLRWLGARIAMVDQLSNNGE